MLLRYTGILCHRGAKGHAVVRAGWLGELAEVDCDALALLVSLVQRLISNPCVGGKNLVTLEGLNR